MPISIWGGRVQASSVGVPGARRCPGRAAGGAAARRVSGTAFLPASALSLYVVKPPAPRPPPPCRVVRQLLPGRGRRWLAWFDRRAADPPTDPSACPRTPHPSTGIPTPPRRAPNPPASSYGDEAQPAVRGSGLAGPRQPPAKPFGGPAGLLGVGAGWVSRPWRSVQQAECSALLSPLRGVR
jgi:hypothetical protein